MSSWNPVITSNPGKMCLVIGGPTDWCSQLSYGPYPVDKKQSYTEQDWQILMSDSYSDKFCEQALMTLASGRQCDIHWPVAEPGHVSFVTDLLDDLNDQEVKAFKESIQGLEYLGVSNRSLSVAAATSVEPCLVTDSETKWFMNWVNSRRNGYSGSKADLGPRQFQAVRRLRKTYFPECGFDHVLVLRGKNATQIQDIQAGENQAVVIMWQKSSQAKFIYASALDAIDFSASENFSLNKWSVVLLYNKGGGPSRNTIRGPAKEPVDLRSSVDGGDSGGGQSSPGRPGSSSGPLPPRPPSPPGPRCYKDTARTLAVAASLQRRYKDATRKLAAAASLQQCCKDAARKLAVAEALQRCYTDTTRKLAVAASFQRCYEDTARTLAVAASLQWRYKDALRKLAAAASSQQCCKDTAGKLAVAASLQRRYTDAARKLAVVASLQRCYKDTARTLAIAASLQRRCKDATRKLAAAASLL